eukprot:5950160-Heterocapsa_arctica.AAC.1
MGDRPPPKRNMGARRRKGGHAACVEAELRAKGALASGRPVTDQDVLEVLRMWRFLKNCKRTN